jgi:hypothetical protein
MMTLKLVVTLEEIIADIMRFQFVKLYTEGSITMSLGDSATVTVIVVSERCFQSSPDDRRSENAN